MNTSNEALHNNLKLIHSDLINRMDRLKTEYNSSSEIYLQALSEIRPLKALEERIKYQLLDLEYGKTEPDYQAIHELISRSNIVMNRSTQLLMNKSFNV